MESQKPKQPDREITSRNKLAFYPSNEIREKIIYLANARNESQSRIVSRLVQLGLKNS